MNGIYSQLSRIKNGGEPMVSQKDRREREEGRRNISSSIILENDEEEDASQPTDDSDPETRFSNLKSFYQSQLMDTSAAGPLSYSGEYGYGSPGALSRIMGLYTGNTFGDKKSKSKTALMREAYEPSEGFLLSPETNVEVQRLQEEGWASTTSHEQRSNQPTAPRFISDLRPVPYLLRTKRSKRCRTCRHILSKPEAKVQTTRFRIRLVALNYIPSMTITPLSPPTPGIDAAILTPLKPTQFLLTLKNPLFDPVKITLATPSHTPGRFSSKITILCPQFEVGANTDVWDEALQDGREQDKRRTAREVGEGQGQAEAGKVWEKGRNWVSVVVEVVPASLRVEKAFAALKKGSDGALDAGEGIIEDENILEFPVFVRVDWETDIANDEAAAVTTKDKEVKEKRELAYWCVLGVGRIADA
jgi:dynactin-4